MEKVYGLRTCSYCKGICHEAGWRQVYGQRRQYWCCEEHLYQYIQDKVTASTGQTNPATMETDPLWQEVRSYYWQPINVVTR